MFNLFFAEAALEIVPKPIRSHPSVVKRAKALGKEPSETLLDRSYHHRAMIHLKNHEKRGRPDIIHFALLEALGTPLNREGMMRIYVHTVDNHRVYVNPKVRLPRNYNRFVGLIEQLYKEGKVPPMGQPLLRLVKGSLEDMLSEIKPSFVVAFTRKGKAKTLEEAINPLVGQVSPAAIIGAFQHGQFSSRTAQLADATTSIDPEMLETWTVTSRVIYEYERSVRLSEKRWNRKISQRPRE